MDLLGVLLNVALIGFIVYVLVTYVPMPAFFKTVIYVLAGLAMAGFLLGRFAHYIPNVLN